MDRINKLDSAEKKLVRFKTAIDPIQNEIQREKHTHKNKQSICELFSQIYVNSNPTGKQAKANYINK